MSGLVLYSGAHCPACVEAERWLRANNCQFQKIDVNGDMQAINWLAQTTGQRTIPQFFFEGRWLTGGFNDVQALAQAGRLR